MVRELLLREINSNLGEISGRLTICSTLFWRYIRNKTFRTEDNSYNEYNNHWDKFWEAREYFKKSDQFMNNGVYIPDITAFEYKKMVIINILEKTIKEYNVHSVLEIGSGGGLNLMLLAPKFPDVQFVGIEPSDSGVRVSQNFILNPPIEFEDAYKKGSIKNVKIMKGSILKNITINELKDYKFDLIFTAAVLEQLNNYLDVAFSNIFSLNFEYFLFFEEWLEANNTISNYNYLVKYDYFRASVNYLNKYPALLLEFQIPPIQQAGLSYGCAFGRKK